MTEQHEREHVHEWNITGTPAMFVIACSKPNCDAELTLDEAEAMLNEYETQKKIIKRLTGFPREEWDWLLEYLPEDCRYILED